MYNNNVFKLRVITNYIIHIIYSYFDDLIMNYKVYRKNINYIVCEIVF